MPVLINTSSGNAENLGDKAAEAAISSGTHHVPLVDSSGNPVMAPYEELPNLLQSGYTQPSPEQLRGLLDYAKFSTPGQQLKTGLEGAASSSTFGLSTAAEQALGVPREDIQKRREINPTAHVLGEMAGLGIGAATGTGEAALLSKLGHGAVGALGLAKTTSALGKIGAASTAMAIENMAFQAGDEVSKMFSRDPHQSMETAAAATNIGLSGLLGFGTGALFKGGGELWKFGPGQKLAETLTSIKNKAQGLPSELKLAADIPISPEVEAALSDNPAARSAFQVLQESTTKSGVKAQEALQEFHSTVKNAVASAINKSPEDIAALGESSKAEVGKAFQESLASTIESKIKPIADAYEGFEAKFGTAPIDPLQKVDMEQKITQLITDQGLLKGPNEESLKLAQKVLGQIGKQETASDLRLYMQNLSQTAPYGSEKYYIGKELRGILSDGLDNTIGQHAGESFRQVQSEYANFKGLLSDMSDKLRLGREGKSGAAGFIEALRGADPESIVNKLSLKGDTRLQAMLDSQFPEAGQLARNQEINNLVKTSIDKEGTGIDSKKFFNKLDKLEPELKNYMFSPKAQTQLAALKDLLNRVPSRINGSGTAKALDALWRKMPESAAAVGAMLTGHNPIAGYLLGKAANYVGREAPDAARLAMLKFLGGKGEVSPEGFKIATHVAGAVQHGEEKLDKAVEHIFGHGTVRTLEFPTEAHLEKLRERLDKVAEQPIEQQDENHMQVYVPDHGNANAMITARAQSYLSSIKPQTAPNAPLDKPTVPSKVQEAQYNQALLIAEQPLSVLYSIKQGSLTQQEMVHLQNLYPALYGRMQNKIIDKLTEHKGDGGEIPYKTAISLSMFMGQPLESSLSPQAILASQPIIAQPGTGAPQAPKNTVRVTNKLDKIPGTYMTPGQRTDFNRASRH